MSFEISQVNNFPPGSIAEAKASVDLPIKVPTSAMVFGLK